MMISELSFQMETYEFCGNILWNIAIVMESCQYSIRFGSDDGQAPINDPSVMIIWQ